MSAWWSLAALGVVGYAWTAEFGLRRAQTVARATILLLGIRVEEPSKFGDGTWRLTRGGEILNAADRASA